MVLSYLKSINVSISVSDTARYTADNNPGINKNAQE